MKNLRITTACILSFILIVGAVLYPHYVANAYTFGKEDFESCGAIPCSFDANTSTGSGAMSLDATSKVNGVDSMRCDINAAGDRCRVTEAVASASEYYVQMTIFLPTGWAFGPGSVVELFGTEDGVGQPVYCDLEDYGTIRLTCGGDELAYTDTGIDLSLNTITKLEFRIKIGAATGDLDIWVNNNTAGSPNYNGSGTLNTGTQNITTVRIGGVSPDIVNDRYYDDIIVDNAFIGAGVTESTSPASTVRINNGAIDIDNGKIRL